jgi:hypothetical protein
MTATNIFFVKVTNFQNEFLGAKVNAYVAVNENGKFGYLPKENKPYCPIGGKKTLESVKSILIFK